MYASMILTMIIALSYLFTKSYIIVLSTSIHFFTIPHFTRHYILSFVEISKFFTYPGFSITFMSSFSLRDYYGVLLPRFDHLHFIAPFYLSFEDFYLESICLSRCSRAIDLLPFIGCTFGTHILIGALAAFILSSHLF